MIDDKLRQAQMARIRALMARTTANGCTEAEAESAAIAVDALLAKYEMDLDEVSASKSEVVMIEIMARKHAVRHMATTIAKFCDAKVWTQEKNLVFLATEIDSEVAEYLVLLMMRAIDRESDNFTTFNVDYAMRTSFDQDNMLMSFQVGMCSRLNERLTHMKSSRDFSQKTSGFSLVLSKGTLVAEAFGTLGINLGHAKLGRPVTDQASYQAGRNAAESVSINQGVRGGSTAAGRIQ